jgi:hypothetical protein
MPATSNASNQYRFAIGHSRCRVLVMSLTVADGLAERIGRSGDFQVILEDDLLEHTFVVQSLGNRCQHLRRQPRT